MSSPFENLHYWHHSPSAVQKPLAYNLFDKMLRARGEDMRFGCAASIGRAAESYVQAMLVDGLSESEAFAHALSVLDGHKELPWDIEADKARMAANRPVFADIAKNALAGCKEALKAANQILGQQRIEKRYPGLLLPFLGFSDFTGGNRAVELKIKTSFACNTSKSGKRAGSLPSKPDPLHAQQLAFYADAMGCPASLVYANEKDFRIFDETNCVEFTPDGIVEGVGQLRARAWSRENVMRAAPDTVTLMQMLEPNFDNWCWRIDPKLLAEARQVWGLTTP